MPLSKLWMIAYRDLGRNRRRTLLSLLAVALGLALLMVMNGFAAGIFGFERRSRDIATAF